MPAEGFTRVFVTVDAFLVIFLAFAFAFGNGWTTALRLGINPYIAPFMQPAVDLAVIGLMVGIRYLAVHGWTDDQLKLPRRWLRCFGFLTLAMNCALPLTERHWGRAAWDAIGPLLLIAWSELAPWLLRAIYSVRQAEQVEQTEQAEEPEPQVAAQPPAPPSKGLVFTMFRGTPREVVRAFLLDWDKQGRTYAEEPAAALKALRDRHPRAVQLSNPVGDRRIGQLCQEIWDSLYADGMVSTPRQVTAAAAARP
jgi:hypothetical protein